MKHANEAALVALSDTLATIRTEARLTEKKPGIFYLGARAFLHFHEDPKGLFADIRTADDWERIDVSSENGKSTLLRRLTAHFRSLPVKVPRLRGSA